jgi:hypothetical protein
MIYYSQRDSKWKDEKLGSTTIGTHGCLVTALAQLLLINGYDETPKTVKDKLESVGGFVGTNNNLLVWGAIEKVFNAKGYWTNNVYNNDKVIEAIEKYGGCIVRVDASRIGASEHWVLYVGDGQMIDPWTGVLKSTSYYPATGYSIVEVERKDTMDFLDEDIKTEVEEEFGFKELDGYDKYSTYRDLFIDYVKVKKEVIYERAEKEKYKKEARELREVVQSQAEEIQKAKKEIERLSHSNAEQYAEIQSLQGQFAEVSRERDSLLDCCKGYETTIPKLKATISDLETKLSSQEPLKKYSKKELIIEIFNRIFKRG